MASVNRKIKKVGYYLIADHPEYGKDQIVSKVFYKNADTVVGREIDAHNAEIVGQAVIDARKQGYDNFRIESVESVAITIPQGIIGWQQVRTRIAKY